MSFIKKETLAQAFSYDFCEIFKNIFFIEHLPWLLLVFVNSLNYRHKFCKEKVTFWVKNESSKFYDNFKQ